MKFGRLTFIDEVRVGKYKKWVCVCDCGTIKMFFPNHLKSGATQSCGCLNKEMLSINKRTHGHSHHLDTHGTYKSYLEMKHRCYNPKSKKWHRYGGRGITICDRWKDNFLNFLEDMGERQHGTTLDRINNDGNYEPSNCRWATPKMQSNNTSRTILLTHNNQTHSAMEWSEILGIKHWTLLRKLRKQFFNQIIAESGYELSMFNM